MSEEFDWIPQDPAALAALKAEIKANRERAVQVRGYPPHGIKHNFVCGCQVVECSEGDLPVLQCIEHLKSDQFPDSHRLPDYADVFAENTLRAFVEYHRKQR